MCERNILCFCCCVTNTCGSQEIFMHSGPQKIAFWEMRRWWALRVSEEPLGKMSVSAGEGGVCSITGMTKTEPSQLSNHQGLATALYQPGRGVDHACKSVQHEAGKYERPAPVFANKKFASPPSSHFSGGLAFLARRGSSQVVVLLLWLKYKEGRGLEVQ